MSLTITNVCVFLPDDVVETTVHIDGARIAEVGGPVRGAELDGQGLILAPAMVDVHGDAFERQIMPRPGVHIPLDIAILETDKQLATNGIATAYHALTISWEPGLRSLKAARAFTDALNACRPRLTVDNRVQLRWETFALDATDFVVGALQGTPTPSLAFNDHTSLTMLAGQVPVQKRPFDYCSDDYPVAAADDAIFRGRVEKDAKRAGITVEAYEALLRAQWDRRHGVEDVVEAVAAAARGVGAPMLSHDDAQIIARETFRGRGARISEFPMQVTVAEAARAAGDLIVFGAPNAARGGSHVGSHSPSAGDMVEAGLCDALASDYYYPAMLAAVARLDRERRAPRPTLWACVSSGPAKAMGLEDRGTIAPGQRADLVFVDWPSNGTPTVRGTFVGGRTAYVAAPLAAVAPVAAPA